MSDEPAPAAQTVKGIMHTIWGHLEKVDDLSVPAPNIQVRTILFDGTVLRVRAEIGPETLIARGIEPVDLSDLRKGKFVEVSYRHGSDGKLDVERSMFDRSRLLSVGVLKVVANVDHTMEYLHNSQDCAIEAGHTCVLVGMERFKGLSDHALAYRVKATESAIAFA
jgi:hypothetical protein